MVLVVKCLICNKELTYTQGNPCELITHMKFEHPNLSKRKNDQKVEESNENSKKIVETLHKSAQTEFSFFKMSRENSSYEQKRKNSDERASFERHQRASDEDKSFPFRNMDLSALNASKRNTAQEKTQYLDAQSLASDNSLIFEKPHASSSPKQFFDATEKTPLCESSCSLPREKSFRFKHSKQKGEKKEIPKLKTFYKTSIEKWKPVGEMKIHCPRCQAHKRPVVKACKEHVTESSIVSAFFMACLPLYCSPCCFLPPPAYEMLRCSICDFKFGIYDHKKQLVFPNPNLDKEL